MAAKVCNGTFMDYMNVFSTLCRNVISADVVVEYLQYVQGK